jgi:MFS-type transporter involved in bile tolerance (Atg22 family)
MFAVLPKLYGLEVAGRATGFQNTFASAGAFVFPLMIGYSRDQTASFDFGWISMAIFCGAGVMLTLMLQHPLSKRAR